MFSAADDPYQYGSVLFFSVIPLISLLILLVATWILIVKYVLIVRSRQRYSGSIHKGYGMLFDESEKFVHLEKGGLSTSEFDPAKASFGKQ